MNENKIITMVYTNYKGKTSVRTVIPEEIYFGHTDWHPEDQWLMKAYDMDKQDERIFAMKDIRSWF